jgi:hypothetical protein
MEINLNNQYSKKVIISFLEKSKELFPEYKFKIKNKTIQIKRNKKKISSIQIKTFYKTLDVIKRLGENKLYYKSDKKIFYKKDPLPALEKKSDVKRLSDGLFQFQGTFLKVFRLLNNFFYNLAIKKYKAVDQENPILWPIDLFKKIDYFSEFPQQILMVSGLKKNSTIYKNFSKNYSVNKNFKEIKIGNYFENSKFGLQPAVCDNCYYALKNIKKFKNSVFTTYNKVFRNEFSKKNSLDRLISFSVRDIMFVGTRYFVKKTRDNLLIDIKNFFINSGLSFTIEIANDPFFIGKFNKNIFQQSHELKYEILANIPFLKKKIAIGSINYHLDTFGRAFNIKNKNQFIYSGCIGIGFERLVLAIYSQYGVDTKKWPPKFLSSINYQK